MRDLEKFTATGVVTGVDDDKLAYIKHTIVEGAPVFTVFSSVGDELARFDDRDIAIAVVLQNDLVPVSVH